MRFIKLKVLVPALLGVLCAVRVMACADRAGTEQLASTVIPAIVRLSVLGQGPGCDGSGTGFFVSPGGQIMTAAHVVPKECKNLTIKAEWTGSAPAYAHVTDRSDSDIALLELDKNPAASVSYLQLKAIEPATQLLMKRVIVPSWYIHDGNPTYTAAIVDSVVISGAPDRWVICGSGSNKSRSGSPIVDEAGETVAVYDERPHEGSENQQDRTFVVPIKYASGFKIQSTAGAPGPIAVSGQSAKPASLSYAFWLDLTANAKTPLTQSAGRYIFYGDGHYEDSSGMSTLDYLLHVSGAATRYPELFTPSFDANAGYRFVAADDAVKLVPSSFNPPSGPLPNHLCKHGEAVDCFSISADGKKLTLFFRLFAAGLPDQAHGWFHGDVLTRQALTH